MSKPFKYFVDEIYSYVLAKIDHSNIKHETPKHLMLIVSEISEAMDAWRDDDWSGVAEEFADIIMRTIGLATALDIDIEKEILNKMVKNWNRPKFHGRIRH